MSEQEVKRYKISTDLRPEAIAFLPDEVVSGRDYDALHAEAEALHRQVTELTSQRDAILLQARCWAGEAKAQQAITKAVGEALGGVPDWGPIAAGVEALRAENGRLQSACDHNKTCAQTANDLADQLSTELEAARGLLRRASLILGSQGYSAWDSLAAEIEALLTATPAPEVRYELSPGWPDPLNSPQADAIRSGMIDDTEIMSLFDKMEQELRLHRERFVIGERQEAVAPAALRKRFSEIEDEVALGKHNAMSCFTAMRTAALYTLQPGPDVRGLVEALEQIARWDGFPPTGKFWEGSGEPVSFSVCYGSNGERDYMRNAAAIALNAYRQAQQGGSHDT